MQADLDIGLLRTFQAVARLGRFRTAAQHLHKSPAAISVHIQRLEAVAGGQLLERDNQAVALTPLGQRLLRAASELLSAHDRLLGELHGANLAGRVILGVPDEYAAHVIGDLLPQFSAAWPNVVLEVTTAPSYTLREQVARGKVDLALIAQPRGPLASNVRLVTATTPVWVGGLGYVPDPSAPLPLAVYAADCPYRQTMTHALTQAGRAWRVVLDSASGQAVRACVEAGLGVTLVDRAKLGSRLRMLDGLPAIDDHEVVLMWPAHAAANEAVEVLAEAIQQNFRLQG